MPERVTAYVTISVDDGHPTDLRTAEMLARHGLEATFYIPARNPSRERMADADVREIATGFDVGGHTLNHRTLRGLREEEAWAEVEGGRSWMEDLLGRKVDAFCYPKGKFDAICADAVRRAGYRGARTCEFNRNDFSRDPYAWGVSTHAYSHPRHVQVRHALLGHNWSSIASYAKVHRFARDWEVHFGHALDWVGVHGGVAHLYLHSWEIERHAEWSKLDRVFDRIAKCERLLRVTNAELFCLEFPT